MQIAYDENKPDEPLDLNQWSCDWLQTKGVSKISYEKEVADGGDEFKNFMIRQTYCRHSDSCYRR